MPSFNSIAPYLFAKTKDLQEAFGITQFPSETNWAQVIGGLIVQGGFVETASSGTVVPFNTAFPKQTLTVIVQPANTSPSNFYVDAVTLEQFEIAHGGGGSHDYYWFAIGV